MRHTHILNGTTAILLLTAAPALAQDQDTSPFADTLSRDATPFADTLPDRNASPFADTLPRDATPFADTLPDWNASPFADPVGAPVHARVTTGEGSGTIGIPSVTSTGQLVAVLAQDGSFDRFLLEATVTSFLPAGGAVSSGGVYGSLVEIRSDGVAPPQRELFVNGTWSYVSRSVGQLVADVLVNPDFGSPEFVGRIEGRFAIPAGVFEGGAPSLPAYEDARDDIKFGYRAYEDARPEGKTPSPPYDDARPDRRDRGFPYEDARPDKVKPRTFPYEDARPERQFRVFPYDDARPDRRTRGFPYEDARVDRKPAGGAYEDARPDRKPVDDGTLFTADIWLSIAIVQ